MLSIALCLSSIYEADASSATPSISVLPSTGPSTIQAPKARCTKQSTQGKVTFHLRVKGIKLSTSSALTKKPATGEARIQLYLDSLPKDAYTTYNKHSSTWLSTDEQTDFPLCFALPILHDKKGKHTIIIALAKTTGVLYLDATPAKFKLTAK